MDNAEFTIKEYLDEIQKATFKIKKTTGLNYFCYRGENQQYEFHSVPNLFRQPIFDMYQTINGFEKNILEEVSVNRLTKHGNDLEIAMDAQHGGFPSRLLDITFNSLMALFFAVVPHYTQPIESNDDKNGKVIVYGIDQLSTSSSKYVNNLYENIITENDFNKRFDGYYHYLIDYVELNTRIKAQQGGFILFCGDQYIPIPEWKQYEIIIPHKAKPLLRDQLKHFFDITMGTVYPEPNNKVEFLVEKSKLLVQEPHHLRNILNEINRNIKWYDDQINLLDSREKYDQRNIVIFNLELYITEIIDSIKDYDSVINEKDHIKKLEINLNEIIKKINSRYGTKAMKSFKIIDDESTNSELN